jgi:hypothetical protein
MAARPCCVSDYVCAVLSLSHRVVRALPFQRNLIEFQAPALNPEPIPISCKVPVSWELLQG